MGFCALGLGFMKKNNRKMGMGFQFEQHRLGLCDLSWDLKKTISREMGLGPPLHDPLLKVHESYKFLERLKIRLSSQIIVQEIPSWAQNA